MALLFGHRRSVDLDLFFNGKFDYKSVEDELMAEFGSDFVYESGHKKIGIFCTIQKIKVDIVYFPHLTIKDCIEEDTIRMYSIADIAAMKIQAILGRAQKKDFWDLFELLKHYPLQQLMDWHKQKYPNQMLAISIPNAISYFVDAEESETPMSFKKQTWDQVKNGIKMTVNNYLR